MKTREIAEIGILSALMIVFTMLSGYFQIGTLTLNLALVVIVVAACRYGKLVGFLVGAINGVVILLQPATAAFYAVSFIGTLLICPLKTGLAGLVCAIVYDLLKDKNQKLAVGIAGALVPITNTGVFILGSVLFFKGIFGQLITIFVTVNFVVELITTVVLSLAIAYILKARR
ncbi:MAG: ECF transporter S component [Erysipelotrichaceae bacterium]|nr:ECF transporter S component [Erysipelotrichaceae bacterium]